MSTFNGVPPYNGTDLTSWILNARIALNGLLNGRTNNTGSFTLSANTVSSVITLAAGRLGTSTVITYSPTTANAATEIGNGTMFISSTDVANNTFTLTNANSAQTNRIFNFILVG